MQKIILFIYLLSFQKHYAVAQSLLGAVSIQEDDLLKKSPNFSTSYFYTFGKCKITWQVFGEKKLHKALYLRLRYQSINNLCPPFKLQLAVHHHILNNIFKSYSPKYFKSISTDSLALIQPTYAWNILIAQRAVKHPDWIDYVKHYPRHTSKKSSNTIFVEVFNQVHAGNEVGDLFLPYGLNLELISVEKVFARHLNKLPFRKQLKYIKFKARIMYDAGILHFKPKVP